MNKMEMIDEVREIDHLRRVAEFFGGLDYEARKAKVEAAHAEALAMNEPYVVLAFAPDATFGRVAKICASFSTRYPATVLEDALNEMQRTGFTTAPAGAWWTTCKRTHIDHACASYGAVFQA